MADQYIKKARESRKSAAVLKLELITMRTAIPDTIIIAIEGNDDKFIYTQWIRRTAPDLDYELFPCGGKKYVRQLKSALKRDLSDLGDGVYYIVDRDFDDLPDNEIDESIFMLDRYSVENYLISSEVVRDVLRNEFNCHARIDIREDITRIYERDLNEFLAKTAHFNQRIFYARRLKIEILSNLTDKISDLAQVQLGNIAPSSKQADELIKLKDEPTAEQVQQLSSDFSHLDPADRYRGKFVFLFLMKWISLLFEEYKKPQNTIFGDMDRRANARLNEVTLNSLAARSPMPAGMKQFTDRMGCH